MSDHVDGMFLAWSLHQDRCSTRLDLSDSGREKCNQGDLSAIHDLIAFLLLRRITFPLFLIKLLVHILLLPIPLIGIFLAYLHIDSTSFSQPVRFPFSSQR